MIFGQKSQKAVIVFFEKMHFYTSPFQEDVRRGVELRSNFGKVGMLIVNFKKFEVNWCIFHETAAYTTEEGL